MNKKPYILSVEDDKDSQKLINILLENDYEVLSAESVSEAKDHLRNQSKLGNSIDMILLDLSLKGDKNGLYLSTVLRRTKQYKDTPIIAVTAHAMSSDRAKCIDAGCTDYMPKPIYGDDLLKMVDKHLK